MSSPNAPSPAEPARCRAVARRPHRRLLPAALRRPLGCGGGNSSVADRLGSVEVKQVDAPNGTRLSRVGVEMRDQLLFDLTGGGPAQTVGLPARGQARARRSCRSSSTSTARARKSRTTASTPTYTLIDNATGKPVVTGHDLLARVVQYSRPAAALRRRPRPARRREPRRQGHRRQYPHAPRVVFRGRDVSFCRPREGGDPVHTQTGTVSVETSAVTGCPPSRGMTVANDRHQSLRRRSLHRQAGPAHCRSCWSTDRTPAWCASASMRW